MFDLTGKTVLIVGASSGLGAHFAAVLSKAGASLVLAARRIQALEKVAGLARANGNDVVIIELDVTKSASIAAAAGVISRVDVLVNNAGITRNAVALQSTQDDWDAVMDTNLRGMFLLSQAVASAMRDTGKNGSIINIASILGLRQAAGVLPYAVSKAGVIQMMKTMALELARFGIRVNALAPGYIDTDLNRGFWKTEAGEALVRRIPQPGLANYRIWMGRCCCWQPMRPAT